jgi:hypothetical protein
MSFAFFKRPKPRQFNYKPIYYDPAKEEAEERKKALDSLQQGDARENMRKEIRRKWRADRTAPDKKTEVSRVLIYVLVAALSLYFIFFTDFVNRLVSFFVR